jgi:hypothetical protein
MGSGSEEAVEGFSQRSIVGLGGVWHAPNTFALIVEGGGHGNENRANYQTRGHDPENEM